MKAASHLFVEDLKYFSKESIRWCLEESEQASSNIAKAIDVLMQDTERVSVLSQSSLDAIASLRTDTAKELDEKKPEGGRIVNLIVGLKALCAEHDDVRDMIDPILLALQFQDRMKQNLDNLIKMLLVWLEFREKLAREGKVYGDEEEREFGNSLYPCTTMVEERDLIKKFFPASEQPAEGATESVSFF